MLSRALVRHTLAKLLQRCGFGAAALPGRVEWAAWITVVGGNRGTGEQVVRISQRSQP